MTGPGEPAGEGFDARLARLERIVGDLEGGELELEPAIARYKDGVRLLEECRAILGGFKKQVEELSKSAAGPEPYAADPDARAGGREAS
jgi:exodeoxyribonuclease VII small subunit